MAGQVARIMQRREHQRRAMVGVAGAGFPHVTHCIGAALMERGEHVGAPLYTARIAANFALIGQTVKECPPAACGGTASGRGAAPRGAGPPVETPTSGRRPFANP
jgi:hypothetical protein